MYFSSIRAAIKVILDALATGGTVGVVYNGEQNKQAVQPKAWPAVELVRLDSRSDFLDNQTDETDFAFDIRIFTQVHHELSQGDAEVEADTVIDAIWAGIMGDVHLNGLLENRMRPLVSARGFQTWNGQNVRMDVIKLACTKLVSLT